MIKERMSVFLLLMFLLTHLLFMTSLNSAVPVLLAFKSLIWTNLKITPFSNQAIVAYNVVKDNSNLTNCFCLHIARNNLSAKKRRKFTTHNASLCPSLYVWQNHRYFNNKVPVSMQVWKNINSQKTKTLARVKGQFY